MPPYAENFAEIPRTEASFCVGKRRSSAARYCARLADRVLGEEDRVEIAGGDPGQERLGARRPVRAVEQAHAHELEARARLRQLERHDHDPAAHALGGRALVDPEAGQRELAGEGELDGAGKPVVDRVVEERPAARDLPDLDLEARALGEDHLPAGLRDPREVAVPFLAGGGQVTRRRARRRGASGSRRDRESGSRRLRGGSSSRRPGLPGTRAGERTRCAVRRSGAGSAD